MWGFNILHIFFFKFSIQNIWASCPVFVNSKLIYWSPSFYSNVCFSSVVIVLLEQQSIEEGRVPRLMSAAPSHYHLSAQRWVLSSHRSPLDRHNLPKLPNTFRRTRLKSWSKVTMTGLAYKAILFPLFSPPDLPESCLSPALLLIQSHPERSHCIFNNQYLSVLLVLFISGKWKSMLHFTVSWDGPLFSLFGERCHFSNTTSFLTKLPKISIKLSIWQLEWFLYQLCS